ncbi:DUF1983 domain-containing protein [Salmonella enterica]|nr:DUF1983 domain-containing protein [Salmonella enterica]
MATTDTLNMAAPAMVRICLYGDLQRFGKRISLSIKTAAEGIHALAIQLPGFRQRMNEGWYQVRIAGSDMAPDTLTARLNESLPPGAVVHIVPRMAGAKNGIWQVVAGAALIGASFIPGLNAVAAAVLFSAGTSMALGGVAQMLTPVPKTPTVGQTDNGKQNTYFSSLENMVAQGNPVTPDSTTDRLQNKTLWSSYTEIIDIRQGYPGTAVAGLLVDAEQFGSQQVTRNYHLRGRIFQVPSNYDPDTRTYTGLWDGTFKPAYTNNPAWCTMDKLTHPRYGLGRRIGVADVDKWALYAIAQYCDQQVPDGFGGTEPRMTLNAYITTQRKAYDVLADFCSVMRCMPVWNGRRMTFIQDRPSDKAWTYTNGNVVGGRFKYSFSALKDRHNAIEVRYTDPLNGWQTSTELVEDHASQARYGRNLLKMDAFGCTSRGQAHRTGLWVMMTELLETQTVDFSVGAEGLRHTSGDIIEVCDNDYAGASVGGRITDLEISTRTLTLDREITLPESGAAMLNIVGPDGKPFSTEIQSQPAPDRVVMKVLPEAVQPYSIWGLKLPSLKRRLFRCVRIKENDDGTYAITALQHVPEKESIVDNGAHFDPLPGTTNSIIPPAVQHLTVSTDNDSTLYQAKAKWDTPRVVKGVRFVVRLTIRNGKDDDPARLVTTATTSETEYAFHELPLGDYTLTVRAINGFGQQGEPSSVTFSIQAPAAPFTIELTPGYFQITVTPYQAIYDASVQYEFWYSATQLTTAADIQSKAQYLGIGSFWIKDGLKPLHDAWFYVRSVNLAGKSVFAEVSGRPSDDAKGYLDFFKGLITEAYLGTELLKKIDLTEDNASKLQQFSKEWQDANDKWNAMWGVKIEQTKDGKYYVAGLGLSMEDTPDGKISQFLVAADRIAYINPANGNETPGFVMQGDQIIMNEAFLKYLSAPTITSGGNPPAFSLTPDGKLTAKNADTAGIPAMYQTVVFSVYTTSPVVDISVSLRVRGQYTTSASVWPLVMVSRSGNNFTN